MASSAVAKKIRRVGVVGYGHLGEFLVEEILKRPDEYELVFVWNRSTQVLEEKVKEKKLKSRYILKDIKNVAKRIPDLIIEVAHPQVVVEHGKTLLECANLMVGSPIAFSDATVETSLRQVSAATKHGVYIPSGAFWGGADIKKMADTNSLKSLKVTMKKHPNSLKLTQRDVTEGERDLYSENEDYKQSDSQESKVLYAGPVRALCAHAPNNVNTMAAAALAAHTLGFDGVQAELIADKKLTDVHIVEIDAWGKDMADGSEGLHVHTIRTNPALVGNVTGSATTTAFLASMYGARDKGPGIHLC